MIALDCAEHGRVNPEVEPSRQRHGPQHADGIFLKTFFGNADAADQPRPDVVEAADVVDDRSRLDVVEERVQREVAPERVFFGRAERVVVMNQQIADRPRSARRRGDGRHRGRFFFGAGRNLAAECRDLDDFRPELHVRQPKAAADDPAVPEKALDLIRVRGGADVEVFRRAAEQQIPHAAADQIGDMVELPQPVQDLERVGVDVLP